MFATSIVIIVVMMRVLVDVGEDEYGQREINRMLSPVFDEAAGLMPVLVEDSDESISSPEQSPTKPVMVLKRPHINKKLSC